LTNLTETEQKVRQFLKIPLHEEELKMLAKAYDIAVYGHEGFFRESGEPFIVHPVEVCKILAAMNVDVVTLAAALLHDVVEDSEGRVTLTHIKKALGPEVERIVDGVTKVSRINAPVGNSDTQAKVETIQKMLFAMAEDMRVIFVKLADRLHNMRTIDFVRDEAKKRYKAMETLEIYAPIAHKLGIYSIKWELEDLSFRILHRSEYNEIKRLVSEKKKERESRTKEYMKQLQSALQESGIEAQIEGRFKHYYGIWRKLNEKGKSFGEIYDLVGIRAIVRDIASCYHTLGVVHSIWAPLPGRIKDYIAAPKSNGYRSLHTTVITGYGEPLEVQIRDTQMHEEAEYGLIAHWIYKNKISVKSMQKWINQLLEWRRELLKGSSYLEDLKKELQMDEVFVFTPKGEIKHLPLGSTPIDFAYSIHTEIGHHFSGAKVNGRMVPSSYRLKSGDVVEILVNRSSSGPSLDWLKYVKSSRTKAKIRRFFRDQLQEELVSRGKDILRKVSRQFSVSLDDMMQFDSVRKYLQSQGIGEEEFYSRVGEGTLTYGDVLKLIGEKTLEVVRRSVPKAKPRTGIEISGMKNIEIHLAKCCGPVPGDPIVGVVSRKGMTIHRINCQNVRTVDPDRIFEARWLDETMGRFQTNLRLQVLSKEELGKMIQVLEARGIAVNKLSVIYTKWNYFLVSMNLEVSSRKQLDDAKKLLENFKSVLSVERGNPN